MSARLTDNLPLLAGAPDGIQKLRELILELAVRGKLVPQNPSDEPASELLKRIAEEKVRLVAEGKIKKQKPLAAIGEEEKPFELPDSWAWVALSEITTGMDSGWSPACESTPSPSDDVWGVLKTTAVQVLQYRQEENKELPAKLEPRPEAEVNAGDILFTRAGPTNRVGISCLVDSTRPRLMISDKIIRFHPVDIGAYGRYIALCLNAGETARYLERAKSGMAASQVNISQQKLQAAPLPLAPLPEQHRIVAKVDELMALCDRLEARQSDAESAHARLVQALLDSLVQASDADDFAASWQRLAEHFHSLFTSESSIDALKQTLLQLAVMGKLVPQDPSDEPARELLKRIAEEKARLVAEGKIKRQKTLTEIGEEERPFELPEGWEWVRLGGLGLTSTGKTPSTSNPQFFGGEIPFIGPGQISVEGSISDPEKWLTETGAGESSLVEAGDILMVCIGGSIGKRAIADRQMAFNQQINSIRVLLADHRYIFCAVSDARFQQSVLDASTGSATPIINRSKWDDLILSLPPLVEQQRIVAQLDQLLTLCDQLKSRLTAARQLHERLARALVEQAVA